MAESLTPSPSDSPRDRLSSPAKSGIKGLEIAIYVLVFIAAILLHAATPTVLPVSVWDGHLIGADAYMQLVRLREFIEVGDWYHNTVSRSNAPYGETIYWTHPFQLVLLVLSGLLWPFFDYPTNVHWAGVLISPILHIILVFVSAWTAKPILGRYRFWVMPIVLVQYPILAQATMGRADHHVLLFVIFMIAMGYVFRMVMDPTNRRLAITAGAVQGIALWFSVEHILLITATLGFGGLWWIFSQRSDAARHQIARLNLRFSASLTATVGVALILERRPQDLLNADVDLISIAYLLLVVVAVAFWLVLDRATTSRNVPFGVAGRFAVSAMGGLAALLTMHTVFPDFFGGPLVHATPIIRATLLDVVADMQPIHTFPIHKIVAIYGSAIISAPALIWLVYRERRSQSIVACLFMAMAIAIYAFVAAKHVRFMPYVVCVGVIPLAFLFDTVRRYSEKNMRRLVGIPVRALTAFLVFLGPGFVFPIFNVASDEKVSSYAETLATCPMPEIESILSALPGNQIILVPYIYAGPEVLYFTRHSVVGTPYQRNVEGIEDTHHVMTATNDDDAKKVVDKRGIGLIMICDQRKIPNFIAEDASKPTFYSRLRNGDKPQWLKRIDLPKTIEDKFTLYAVQQPGSDLIAPESAQPPK